MKSEWIKCPKCMTSRGYDQGDRIYCPNCNLDILAPVCKVSEIDVKQIGYIHSCSKSKEPNPPIGKFFVLLNKKDGKYGVLINGEKFIVNEEWANDHYITPYRIMVDCDYIEEKLHNYYTLEMSYSARTYENAHWDDAPSENYIIDDLQDGEGGYLSIHTGGVWSCGCPYGVYLEMNHEESKKHDAFGYHRPWESAGPVLVCATKHDAFNINYVVNKKDAQP